MLRTEISHNSTFFCESSIRCELEIIIIIIADFIEELL